MLAVLGLRGARARSQGLLCMGLGARLAGPGARTARLRTVPGRVSAPKTWLNRCLRVLCPSQSATAQVSARVGAASGGDHAIWPGSSAALQEQSHQPGCSPTSFQVAVAPGGHTALVSTRRCPLLDARATAPCGVLCSSPSSLCCISPGAAPAAAPA